MISGRHAALGVLLLPILVMSGCVQQDGGTGDPQEVLSPAGDEGNNPPAGGQEPVPESQGEPVSEPGSGAAAPTSPALRHLGVRIEPLNPATSLAGDLLFTRDLLFEDDYIVSEWVFVEFGRAGQRKSDPVGRNVEYWFHVPLGTPIRAPISGTARVSYFEHTQDWGVSILTAGSDIIVSFEHLVDLQVQDGEKVQVNQVMGNAAPRSTYNGEIAMTELAVWQGGRSIVKHCPFLFLGEEVQPLYAQKLQLLTEEWETFIGRDVYDQAAWAAPGCVVESIVER